jgi:hypothetical protein
LEVVDILRRIVTAIEIHPCPERGKVDIKVTGVLAEILAIAHRERAHGKRTKKTASWSTMLPGGLVLTDYSVWPGLWVPASRQTLRRQHAD